MVPDMAEAPPAPLRRRAVETVRAVGDEIADTLRRPSRLRALVDPARMRVALHRLRHGEPEWDGDRKTYDSYERYVAHQRSKLAIVDVEAYDDQLRRDLQERLADQGPWAGAAVLCLAARRGGEVRAFRDLGAFAVGIDLEPGPENRYVLTGDLHALDFAEGSVDAAYCNSLDHALDLDRAIAELRRVLRPGGRVLLDVLAGTDERPSDEADVAGFGRWEVRRWARADDVADAFVDGGFELVDARPIERPWPGRQFTLRAPADA